MAKAFLSAEWRNLIMANYIVDPSLLQKYLPRYTELDTFNENHYISLVGFLFKNVKVRGIAFPFHTNFEEVNLRFYVRYKENNLWKRGVVFMKEIVPRRMITFIANTLYGENYRTHKMNHQFKESANELIVNYNWKVGSNWNRINCIAEKNPENIIAQSSEEFITEHYWGYTKMRSGDTSEYGVEHPRWNVYPVLSYNVEVDTEAIYGKALHTCFVHSPTSVFVAEGSPVKVFTRKIINDFL